MKLKSLSPSRFFSMTDATKERALNVSIMALAMTAAFAARSAGGDDTFDDIVAKLADWSEGSMGKMFALGSLAVGLAVAVVKQSLMAVVVAIGIALTATVGPDVVSNIFGASVMSFLV